MDITGIVFFVIVVIGFIYAVIRRRATGTPISDTLLSNMPGSDPRPSYPGESEASKNIRRTRADIIVPVSAYEWAEYEWRQGDLIEQQNERLGGLREQIGRHAHPSDPTQNEDTSGRDLNGADLSWADLPAWG